MAGKEKPKPLDKKSFVKMPIIVKSPFPKVKIPIVRVPRGPTVRWSIDYNLLFKKKRGK